MSRSKKGSPKLGNVPSKFKHHQNRSKKMKLKESARKNIENPDDGVTERLRKSHTWDYH